MRIHSTIALAAMAVALATPQAVMAKAKSSDSNTQQQLQMAQQQIAQLQAQLNNLQARMDQQAATQTQAAADAQAASAKADKALAQATAATEKASKPAALPKGLEWAADTKVSGRAYFNISTENEKADGVNTKKDGGFQLKRVYIGVDHKFNDMLSGNFTADTKNIGGVGEALYIKKAYLKAKFAKELEVSLGSTDMPWIPYVEGLYGFRHVEKTTTDLFGYGTSADWGVHVGGKFADGLISYQVSAVNGRGYRDPNFTKSIDVEGRLSVQYKGINAAIGGYSGKLGKDIEGATANYRTASRFNALLAYKGKDLGVPVTIGGEYFEAKNWKIKTTSAEDKAVGYSIFASVAPVDKWSVFGRYDWIKPNKDTNNSKKGQYLNLGIQYSPAKIVDLALVYKHYDADYNFTGGDFASANVVSGKRDEFGLFGQFRF